MMHFKEYRVSLRAAVLIFVAGSAAAGDLSSFVSVRTEYDAPRHAASVYITNIGRKAIVAGTVVARFGCPGGTDVTQRMSFDLLSSTGLESKFPAVVSTAEAHFGSLKPEGDVFKMLFTNPPTDQCPGATSMTAAASALVFLDNSSAGDSDDIDRQFETWRDESITLDAWNKRAGELLVPGARVGALKQLSLEVKDHAARHLSTEPRVRFATPANDEEARTRNNSVLEQVSRMADGACDAVERHAISEADAVAQLRDVLRIRTEVTAAHAYRGLKNEKEGSK